MKKELRHCLQTIVNLQKDGYTVWPASLAGYGKMPLKKIKEILKELADKDYLFEYENGVIHITDKGRHRAEMISRVAVS